MLNFRYTPVSTSANFQNDMGVFVTSFLRTLRQLPPIHIAAAMICIAVISLIFILMPTEEAEAINRPISHQQPPASVNVDDTSQLVEPDTQNTPPTSVALPISTEPADSKASTHLAEAASPAENWVEYRIQSGDNLTSLFKRAGLGPRDVYRVSSAISGSNALKQLRPGEHISLLVEDGQLTKLRHVRSRLSSTLLMQTEKGYEVVEEERTPEKRTAHAQGQIENSLFLDAARAGLSDKIIMELASILGWDVDFALDIRRGDSFQVLFEEDFLEGEKIGDGNILAARFVNQGQSYEAVRYTDSKGNTNYFTPDGRSMRKAFLRSPVDFRRISSHFKPERFHPVLGKKRPHRGVDYAAATGTPIKAAGDGKVIWRGTKGGYGRTIIIQHGGNITTLYAHMSRYQNGVNNGSRVKQGQVIGYVGASGLATGPHLHYEFRINGTHKNPLTVALPQAESVPASEMNVFTSQTGSIMSELNQRTDTRLALNEPEQ
jgi:murein DD-endopeptidase MepM/ murein hydrolase activator NlpD